VLIAAITWFDGGGMWWNPAIFTIVTVAHSTRTKSAA
jgi:hypothetical protein